MLESVIALLGGGLGGVLRLIPEGIRYFSEKKDRDHEFRMTELQLKIDTARSEHEIDKVHAQGDAAAQAGEMQAFIEAIKMQGQLTGVKWIDGLNSSVRPVVTYWWLILFTVYKAALLVSSYYYFTTWDNFIAKLWTAQDAGTLSMILGFWFVDRSIRKQNGR